jgi:hypothetical protein
MFLDTLAAVGFFAFAIFAVDSIRVNRPFYPKGYVASLVMLTLILLALFVKS